MSKQFRRQLHTCGSMLRMAWEEYAGYLAVLAGYFLACTILPFGAIIFPNRIITQIERQGDFETVVWLSLAMCLFYLVFRNLQNYCLRSGETRGEYLMIRLKMRLNQISMRVPMERLEDVRFQERREVASQISYNSNHFNGYYYSIVRILSVVVQIAVILVLVRRLSPAVLVMLLLFFGCSLLASGHMQKLIHKVEQENAVLKRKMHYLENLLGDYHYGKMIRLHSMGDWLLGISRERREEYCKSEGKGLSYTYWARYVSSVLAGVQEMLIYLYLIWMVLERGITIGEYVLYVAAVHQFSTSLSELAKNITEWKRYGYFADDLAAFLQEEEKREEEGEKEVREGPVRIEFDHVYFRYGESGKWVLEDLCFTINSGEKVTLVGDNGAGKSTLLSLLLRLYVPTRGKILINGVDMQEIREEEYHRLFAMVFQEYQTYAFTLKENILLKDDDGGEDGRVLEALAQSGLSMEKFQDGLHTYIGKQFEESGIELSGGEQQKLAMARAIYRKSPVLILDEPTANLSPLAESKIYQEFYKMAADRTAIFVSHRLSSSRFCDRVLVLDEGRIAESGIHEELMERDGLYREMFTKQASYYQEGQI